MTAPLRVVQWATGNVGRRSLHAILSRPDLELVGVVVHGEDKVGLDAAELAGFPTPSGVLATRDLDEVVALRPDAVVYNPLWSSTDELVALLEAGINVCTTAGWIDGTKLDPAERARVADACERGGSSIYGSGAHPGMTNAVALTLTASCAYVDHVRITESVDCSTYASAETQRAMGFGLPPDTDGLAESVRRESAVFAESVAVMADAMEVSLDRIDFDVTFTAATGHSDLGFMEIPEGTVGSIYGYHRGWVGDQNLISVGFNWTMGSHVVPPKPLKHGHDIQVFGAPNMRTVIHCLPHEEWDEEGFMGLGMIYTAMPVTNAVPSVVAAPPGIITLADLPVVTGRPRRRA